MIPDGSQRFRNYKGGAKNGCTEEKNIPRKKEQETQRSLEAGGSGNEQVLALRRAEGSAQGLQELRLL
jgi:hypothetical protein